MLTNLTTSTFDDAIKTGSVLVLWGAEWHAPSQALANRLQKMALKVKMFGVDIDHEFDLTTRFSIRGIPTLMVFTDGQLVARDAMFTPAIQALIC